MKPPISRPVRNQCLVAHRSSSDRNAESERPPRTNAWFVPAKKIGYVTITPPAVARRSEIKGGAPGRQLATMAELIDNPYRHPGVALAATQNV